MKQMQSTITCVTLPNLMARYIPPAQEAFERDQIICARIFMEELHWEKLSLAVVAMQAGMTGSHFRKAFKKVTGGNFTQYLARLRVAKAKSLLLNPDYPVNDIALEIGFRSLGHFRRVFEHLCGETPVDFRQRLPFNQIQFSPGNLEEERSEADTALSEKSAP